MTDEVTTRPLSPSDAEILRTATLANVNWAGQQRRTYRQIDTVAELRRYHQLRADRGDFGVVAEQGGAVVGVVWVLLLGGADRGYGFVAEGVPELSICVWSGYRGQGIGGLLLGAALDEARRRGHSRLSLSVERGNPAVRLYRRAGFVPVAGAADGTHAVQL